MTNTFLGKTVAVVGVGIEGMSSALYLASKGAKVALLDKNPNPVLDAKFLDQAKQVGITFSFGKDYLLNLLNYQIVVRSPGISLGLEEFKNAQEKGVEITSQTKLF